MCRVKHTYIGVCLLCNSEGLAAFLILQMLNIICTMVHMTEYRQGDVIKCTHACIRVRGSYLDWGAIDYSYRHPVGRERSTNQKQLGQERKQKNVNHSLSYSCSIHVRTYMDYIGSCKIKQNSQQREQCIARPCRCQ